MKIELVVKVEVSVEEAKVLEDVLGNMREHCGDRLSPRALATCGQMCEELDLIFDKVKGEDM
jgi:hypothetical protein